MRATIYIWLLVGLCLGMNVQGQTKDNRSIYATAFYDLNDQLLNANSLDKYTKVTETFGDKVLIRQLILSSMLQTTDSKNLGLLDSLNGLLEKQFNMKPVLGSSLAEDPYLVCVTLFCGHLTSTTRNRYEAYFEYLKWQGDHMPHAPFKDNEAKYIVDENDYYLGKYIDGARWALNYPQEYEYALQVLNSVLETYRPMFPGGSDKDIQELLFYSFAQDNALFDYVLPLPLDTCLEGLKVSHSEIPDMATMRSDAKGFIQEAYKKFYGREPKDEELSFWVDYINQHPEVTPKLVYFAFISSEPYSRY